MIGDDGRRSGEEQRSEPLALLPRSLPSPPPYSPIICHCCGCGCYTLAVDKQPRSCRPCPSPLPTPHPSLYLTCSSGSQQTVKGQKAAAWEHCKYSNRCVFPASAVLRCACVFTGRFHLSHFLPPPPTPHLDFHPPQTQPALCPTVTLVTIFCHVVIESHGWGNRWTVSCFSISGKPSQAPPPSFCLPLGRSRYLHSYRDDA